MAFFLFASGFHIGFGSKSKFFRFCRNGLAFSDGICYNTLNLKKGGIRLKIISFAVGDTLVMKKPHPCGENCLTVLRIGSDVRVRCPGCGRDVTVPRVKLEKNIKSVLTPKGGNT